MWDIAVHAWCRASDLEPTKEQLLTELNVAARREGNELVGDTEYEVIGVMAAMHRYWQLRASAPAPPIDDWRCLIGRATVRVRGRKQAICPECEKPVKNYMQTDGPAAGWRGQKQSQIPDWCELLPCGHVVSGVQIEIAPATERGFLVHDQ